MPDYLTTRELAQLLRIKERKVYDLVNTGKVPFTKATGKLLFPKDAIDEWLKENSAAAENRQPARRPPVFLGSHDPLLEWALRESGSGIATWFDGSADGLDRFEGTAGLAAGLHLFDPETGDWNVPFVAERFGKSDAVLIAWAHRTRGLVTRRGEATGPRRIEDLAGRKFAPRQPRSGTHQTFLHLLEEAGMRPDMLDYCAPLRTEIDAALAVLDGSADATLGLQSVAEQQGLDFTPLIDERFDLLVSRADWFDPPMQAFLEFCRSPEFASKAAAMPGYDVSAFGKVMYNAG
jgi:putative molybdopterin biosynthesis protein